MEISVRRIRADDAIALRAVRLAALDDSPSAFASTAEVEAGQPAEYWAQRARRDAAGDRNITFFATVDGCIVGLVGASRADGDQAVVDLVSMWVAQECRGSGAARQLVDAVLDWASAGSAASVELWVTRGNDRAIGLYESAGFRETGDHQPLPSDPCKDEIRMRRRLP